LKTVSRKEATNMGPDQDSTERGSSISACLNSFTLPTILDENDKKVWVLRAATCLFANRGYAGTTVREIVAMAGVTKPTLYYYFKNKEDLYVKLMDLAMEVFSHILQDSLAMPGSMRQRLVGLYTSVYSVMRANIDFLRFINCAFYGPQGATPDYDLNVGHHYLRNALLEMLRAGVGEGELLEANLEVVVLLLMGLMRSMEELLVMDPVNPLMTPSDITAAINVIFDGPRIPHGGSQT
jgi:TetR/AcrR family transcriptional regulator